MAFCVNCGNQMSDMAAACPNCGHPNESRVAVGTGTYASWGQRVGASLLDSLIIGIPSSILMVALGLGFGSASKVTVDQVTGQTRVVGNAGLFGGFIVSFLVIALAGVLYKVLMEGSERGQTVGKMALKIRVRDAQTGGRVSYGKATLRWFVAWILWIALYIPGIIDVLFPLWDAKKQCLHDKAAGTVVVPAA